VPWRITSRVKADSAAAWLDALEMIFGRKTRALNLPHGDLPSRVPLLRRRCRHAQLDADIFRQRQATRQQGQFGRAGAGAAALRALMSEFRWRRFAAQIELASEAGDAGRTSVAGHCRGTAWDGKSWRIGKLDFRAPGTTRSC